jgi:hypothetical protein
MAMEAQLKQILEPALRVGDSEEVRNMKEKLNAVANISGTLHTLLTLL